MPSPPKSICVLKFRHGLEIMEYGHTPGLYFIRKGNLGCYSDLGRKTSRISVKQAVVTAKKIQAEIDKRTFVAPFCIIPMPLNKYGEGPETNPRKVVQTIYAVWDGTNHTVSEHPSELEAQQTLQELQETFKDA